MSRIQGQYTANYMDSKQGQVLYHIITPVPLFMTAEIQRFTLAHENIQKGSEYMLHLTVSIIKLGHEN